MRTEELRKSVADRAERELGPLESRLQLLHVHLEETFRPEVRRVSVVNWLGQAASGIESIDIDGDTKNRLNAVGEPLEYHQAPTPGHSKLDYRHAIDPQDLREMNTLHHSPCVVMLAVALPSDFDVDRVQGVRCGA